MRWLVRFANASHLTLKAPQEPPIGEKNSIIPILSLLLRAILFDRVRIVKVHR